MTAQDKQEIIDYLTGPRDHSAGTALYQRFGSNLRLKRQFLVDAGSVTHDILVEELRKLAGLGEHEFARLPRMMRREVGASCGVELPTEHQATEVSGTPVPGAAVRMTRFRDRYPFLKSPDCPDVLKILVADMFTAYGRCKESHARLVALGEDASVDAASECEAVVEGYLADREIREELDYYRDHGTILGKSARFRDAREVEDLAAIPDVELISLLQSARTQESKHKARMEAARKDGSDVSGIEAALNKWSARKLVLKAEVDRRKKK